MPFGDMSRSMVLAVALRLPSTSHNYLSTHPTMHSNISILDMAVRFNLGKFCSKYKSDSSTHDSVSM